MTPKFYYPRLLVSVPFIVLGLLLYLFAVLALVTVDKITGIEHSKQLFDL